MPTQMPRNGRPERAAAQHRLDQAGCGEVLHAGAERALPRQHDGRRRAMRSASLVISAGWPRRSNAFCALRRLPTP